MRSAFPTAPAPLRKPLIWLILKIWKSWKSWFRQMRFGSECHFVFVHPFAPHTAHVCHCCTCARPAYLNTPAGRYNEFLSKTPHNDLFKTTSPPILLPSFKKRIPTHLRWQISDNYTPTFNVFPIFFLYFAPFYTSNCVMYYERY